MLQTYIYFMVTVKKTIMYLKCWYCTLLLLQENATPLQNTHVHNAKVKTKLTKLTSKTTYA